ncbi:protein disulfide isomerase [Nannochloropsis gaditana]|nr:protein disulfide isomerase [Nannochloropsis gaditana]
MIKKSGPAVTTVTSVEEAEAFFAKQPTAALALLDSLDSDIALAVTTFAESSDNVPFAYTAEPAVLTNYGAKAGSLRFATPEAVFTRFLDFTGGVTAFEELNTWLFGHSIAPMFEFSPEKSMHLFSGPIRVHLIAFGDATEAGFADTVAAIKEGANKFRTKALSILVGKNETRILEAFDLTEKDVPTMVIADMRAGAMKRFFFEGDMAKAFDTEKFLTNFFAGHLKAKLKSEEPVPEDMEKAVKVIKGKSFQKEVLESDKDVLMEFYAPWCGHCKTLEPKWDVLGDRLAGVEHVMTAKMDYTANELDVPGVDIRGFPTILFFPADKTKEPVVYKGGREVPDFLAFLKEHASKPFEVEEEEEEEEEEEVKEEL